VKKSHRLVAKDRKFAQRLQVQIESIEQFESYR